MNIAIFGGTFNPFHIGHEKMLKSVCNLDYIDKVLVIPDKIPPHKEVDFLASDIDRLNMCKIAITGQSKAQVCDIEIKREGKSYSIYTILSLKERYPNDKFYFVCGGDMIACLDKWYDFEHLVRETSFLAFRRNGDNDFTFDVEKMRKKGADIKVIDEEIPYVSSTEIRKKLDSKYLSKEIFEYIMEKGIYNAR